MIDRKRFFDGIRNKPFSGLSEKQVEGVGKILDEWERRKLTDLRWLAYILATAKWETAHTMQPIREGGGEAYLRSKKYYPWVGEGLVQVTWEANHRKFGATAPGQLLTWPIALRAIFDGMIGGMFTGKKLTDYFTSSKTDWVNARRIVNGTDKASEIALIAQQFYSDLQAANGAVNPPPKPTVAPPMPKPSVAKPAAGGAVIVAGGTAAAKAAGFDWFTTIGFGVALAIAVVVMIAVIRNRSQ